MAQSIESDALKPGDHIYSWRWWWSYAHHGIYVEENRVIHFVASVKSSGWSIQSIASSSSSSKIGPGKQCPNCGYDGQSGVIKTCLDCFVNGRKIYRYEYGVSTKQYKSRTGGTCHTVVADTSRYQIIHRAHDLLEHGFGDYSLTDKNCENFAIYCMTAIDGIMSGQVDKNWIFIQASRFLGSWLGQTGEEKIREDIGDSSEGFCEATEVREAPREYTQGSTSPSLWKCVAEEFCANYKKTV
ncbi:hypothetical protein SUGI_0551000 [Cryptomeria japonica]|uniref:protein LEAD-SENSITIVE 1 n=1 Tax=Cryptomeria japonica TaxID=3369 RepID=UPI002408ED90|nr:protein LEAD-SENSITIVE 1 [Cryptomeria japonica]GLJ28062.1 hypothetical protein SUGI_0551000 [Cryptomeria japonica]